MERGEVMGIVTLDQSAAFDVIDHSILETKMELYGFEKDFCVLMESYLSFRSQKVLVNGKLSGFKPNDVGVPQGSILGPLLFNLYSKELHSLCHLNCKHNIDYSCITILFIEQYAC